MLGGAGAFLSRADALLHCADALLGRVDALLRCHDALLAALAFCGAVFDGVVTGTIALS